jgi:hypothetical protein
MRKERAEGDGGVASAGIAEARLAASALVAMTTWIREARNFVMFFLCGQERSDEG